MRRGPSCWILALALSLGGVAACGGDDGDSTATTTTTTAPASTEPTTTALADPAAAVDEFCAKTDEIKALAQEQENGPTTPAQNEQGQELVGEATQMMFALQGQTAQMVPGDVARFQECASFFNINTEG